MAKITALSALVPPADDLKYDLNLAEVSLLAVARDHPLMSTEHDMVTAYLNRPLSDRISKRRAAGWLFCWVWLLGCALLIIVYGLQFDTTGNGGGAGTWLSTAALSLSQGLFLNQPATIVIKQLLVMGLLSVADPPQLDLRKHFTSSKAAPETKEMAASSRRIEKALTKAQILVQKKPISANTVKQLEQLEAEAEKAKEKERKKKPKKDANKQKSDSSDEREEGKGDSKTESEHEAENSEADPTQIPADQEAVALEQADRFWKNEMGLFFRKMDQRDQEHVRQIVDGDESQMLHAEGADPRSWLTWDPDRDEHDQEQEPELDPESPQDPEDGNVIISIRPSPRGDAALPPDHSPPHSPLTRSHAPLSRFSAHSRSQPIQSRALSDRGLALANRPPLSRTHSDDNMLPPSRVNPKRRTLSSGSMFFPPPTSTSTSTRASHVSPPPPSLLLPSSSVISPHHRRTRSSQSTTAVSRQSSRSDLAISKLLVLPGAALYTAEPSQSQAQSQSQSQSQLQSQSMPPQLPKLAHAPSLHELPKLHVAKGSSRRLLTHTAVFPPAALAGHLALNRQASEAFESSLPAGASVQGMSSEPSTTAVSSYPIDVEESKLELNNFDYFPPNQGEEDSIHSNSRTHSLTPAQVEQEPSQRSRSNSLSSQASSSSGSSHPGDEEAPEERRTVRRGPPEKSAFGLLWDNLIGGGFFQ